MDHQQRSANIETLARMAARLAGRDPEEHIKLELGEVQAFEGPMWCYHDFLMRAEQAYALLALEGEATHPERKNDRRDFAGAEREMPTR
jgi:hypothetical protein